jgi:hypothetical protein
MFSHLDAQPAEITLSLKNTPIVAIERTRRLVISQVRKSLYLTVFKQDGITIRMWLERLTVLAYPNGSKLLNKHRRGHKRRSTRLAGKK